MKYRGILCADKHNLRAVVGNVQESMNVQSQGNADTHSGTFCSLIICLMNPFHLLICYAHHNLTFHYVDIVKGIQ